MLLVVFLHQAAVTVFSQKQHQTIKKNMVMVLQKLRKNFYVNNLLKSVNTGEVASQLVDDVRKMCKVGGFHLTKFICNDKEVLTMIPEEDRKQGKKN